jgi:uncharacterized protein (TIGR03435 family)
LARTRSLVKVVRVHYKGEMRRDWLRGCWLSVSWVVCIVTIAGMGMGLTASAQAPSGVLAFEVATVKPVDPSYRFDGTRFWAHVNPAGASFWYMTPTNLIEYAYGVESFQVAGPEWTDHDRFDIEARLPAGADKKNAGKMMQALLKDRFKLAFHLEKREIETYVLEVGKHGATLKPSLPDPASRAMDSSLKPGDTSVGASPAKPKIIENADGSSTVDLGTGGTQTIRFDQERMALHFEVSKMTVGDLASRLGNCLGSGIHKVVDETGIQGTYQIAWDCPEPMAPSSRDEEADGTLPGAPQDGYALRRSLEALGLKLEKRKTLMDVYVIDHIEQPSEN